MLSFKKVNTVFLLVLLSFLVLHYYIEVSALWILPFVFIYLIIVIYGSFVITSQMHVNALCNKNTEEKEIAITFDDGPNVEVTAEVLDLLKKNEIKAGFFCIGKNIEGNEAIVKRMDEEGHIIGNHSYEHAFFYDFFPASMVLNDYNKSNELITNTIGKKPLSFRPPYGVTNPAIARAVRKLNCLVIGWSIRSFDTKFKEHDKVMGILKDQLKPGAIVLFHDKGPRIITLLKAFIEYVHKSGYKIVRFDKLLGIEAYA